MCACTRVFAVCTVSFDMCVLSVTWLHRIRACYQIPNTLLSRFQHCIYKVLTRCEQIPSSQPVHSTCCQHNSIISPATHYISLTRIKKANTLPFVRVVSVTLNTCFFRVCSCGRFLCICVQFHGRRGRKDPRKTALQRACKATVLHAKLLCCRAWRALEVSHTAR